MSLKSKRTQSHLPLVGGIYSHLTEQKCVPDHQGPAFHSYLNEEGTLVGAQSDIPDNPLRWQDQEQKGEWKERVELTCRASHISKEIIHKK